MNTKNNLRYREMETRLEAAMLELMQSFTFEKITVKKLCETAGVNRSTFYAHFIDIYDMVEKMESLLQQKLLNSLPSSSSPENMMFSKELLVFFLKHIRKYQYFYRIALKTRKEFPLKQGFEDMWNQVIKPKCEKAGISSEDEMIYYFVYYQAGFTMTLKRWVDNDCKESEQEIAALIYNCIPSVWQS